MGTELVAFYTARLDEKQQAAEVAQRQIAERVCPPVQVEEYVTRAGHWEAVPWLLSGRVVADVAEWGKVEIATIANDHVAHHDPAHVLADVAADRKLIARYKAAVESHQEALQALRGLRKADAVPGEIQAADADLAAASGREGAFLTVLEDRAARFSDHEDYQPHWRQP
jgi:hypothetical protein